MKYKHGFIGNSSSASYYIRRGNNHTRDTRKMSGGGGGSANETLTCSGSTLDSYYSWHPATTGVMKARMVTPVANGWEAAGDRVKSISFKFFGVTRRDHDAANLSHTVPHTADVFSASANWRTYYTYSVDTTATGYQLKKGIPWASPATVGSGLSRGAGTGETSGFDISVGWTGSVLVINGAYSQSGGSTTMSCAICITNFSAEQDEQSHISS